MRDQTFHYSYWGKADASYVGAAQWHPFAYHSLDVAAVAAEFWAGAAAVWRGFGTAFGTSADDSPRARILLFVALHDIGKLHALFQIKAGDALREAWPAIELESIRPRPYDHGCDGFAQADDEVPNWIANTRRDARADTFSN